jgi:hypothetical protein
MDDDDDDGQRTESREEKGAVIETEKAALHARRCRVSFEIVWSTRSFLSR